MSSTEHTDIQGTTQIQTERDEPTYLKDTTPYPSSRTVNSSSRLSNYTDAATRRSSFQSAQASIYQDTEASLAFESANESAGDSDLDSDLEVHSQRAPSRSTVRSRTASPFQAPVLHDDGIESTVDTSGPLTGPGGLTRRTSVNRQSIERPLSSLSRRSSSGTQEDPHRLRDAATAAANRSSMSARRRSSEIDLMTSRASTPHGYQRDGGDAAAAGSRPNSSLALRQYDQDDGSFVKRDGARDRGSILPPAGFFAPKKPSARNSSSDLLATSGQGARSTTPLSFYSNGLSGAMDGIDGGDASEGVLRYRSTSPAGLEDQTRAPSPWALATLPPSQSNNASNSVNEDTRRYSQIADGTDPLHPLAPNDGFPSPSTHPSPTSGFRMMASMDPLLPNRAISNAANGNQTSSTSTALGLVNDSAIPDSKLHVTEQRASPPKTVTSSTSKIIDTNGTSPTRKAAVKPPRNYHAHQGDNRFLLSGLLITSGDNPFPFILSLLLLLVLGGLFLGFESPWLTRNISPAIPAIFAYIYLQALVNMLVTAFRDPGILPRNLDPDPPCVLSETPFTPGRQAVADPEDPMAIPVQRVLRIRGQVVKSKWCETCGTYRPPRSSHCRVCDNCVENIDHHCSYLNTCIGRRNYVSFMAFLIFSILSALWVVGCTAARLVLMTKSRGYRFGSGGAGEGLSFQEALGKSPVSAVLFLLCIAATGPLVVLFTYHLRLVLLNRSTVEQIRINTTREYGEHKDLELGTHGDEASIFGDDSNKQRGMLRRVMERFGMAKPQKRDPNPFASRRWRRNVRNGVGWRSVELDSWLERRGRRGVEVRERHPRARQA